MLPRNMSNVNDLDIVENGETYRWLLLGRQTWDLHDCDSLMVGHRAAPVPSRPGKMCKLVKYIFDQFVVPACANFPAALSC